MALSPTVCWQPNNFALLPANRPEAEGEQRMLDRWYLESTMLSHDPVVNWASA